MSEDEIDRLYAGAPKAFTALRAELVAAAKRRGDKAAAVRIGAARRPTTAAWVVNVLVRSDPAVRDELHELGERLRAAHSAMDGGGIRELSRAQRKLIDHLTWAAFAAAGVAHPTTALRDDVVGTLQAAIADPDVADRLGRLSKAERWSGFGEFGTVVAVGGQGDPKSTPPAEPLEPVEEGPTEGELAAVRDVVAAARTTLADAERRHAATVDEHSTKASSVATARRRYEKLLEKLSAAEEELSAANAQCAAAELAVNEADVLVQQATAHLVGAESDLANLGGRT